MAKLPVTLAQPKADPMRRIQMCCLNLPGNCYPHKNVGMCEKYYYFPQMLLTLGFASLF